MNVSGISARSLAAGGAVIATGLFSLWESLQYAMGTARMIGPAVFPFGLSLLMVGVGVVILINDLRTSAAIDEIPPERIAYVNLAAILGAMAAFGFLLERLGLVPAIFAGVLISSFADRSLSLRTAFLIALVLSVACTLVFSTFLKLPLSAFAL